ncbi:TldD/PmbA family protein [Candidatus Micrarchaeota archaeon]|nr:TldD/PmbA family protein [Candidatus Micrarchaeota archaeon]
MYDYIIQKLDTIKCDYWDIRLEDTNTLSLNLENSEFKVQKNYYEGLGIRILNQGSWGFASINQLNKSSFDEALCHAIRLSKIKSNKIQINKYKKQKYKDKRKDIEIDLEVWTNRLKKIEKITKGKYIISTAFNLIHKDTYSIFLNSEGSSISQKDNFSYCGPRIIAKKGKILQSWTDRQGKLGIIEKLDNLEDMAINAKNKVINLLNAKPCPKGIQNVILDPQMVGVFCHEAIGHAAEADIISKGDSILEKLIGKQIGNNEVTIIDSPNEKNGFGNINYDSEGVKAKKVVIIKKGIVNSFLHSRETSKKSNEKLTGNARASNYNNFPIVRMRNTVMLPGKHSKEDVFDLKTGVYLKGMKGGQVKTLDGKFMFAAREAYNIKNGEIQEQLRDVSISGNITNTLYHIEAIGKDYDPTGVGFCGKDGQSIRAGDGGPHIRIKNILLG